MDAKVAIAVLAGPTASGKTSLAVEVAGLLGAEIVSADSQQVYRGLDVGTAKPSAEERAAAPHHLLDVAEPGEGMDAARFASLADQAIADIAARGRFPLVVGGTGLYLRTLLHGVVAAPGRDPALRARLEEEAARHGRGALHARLAAMDPAAAARIRPNDLVRVVRALEIAAGGRTQSELFAAHGFAERRYRYRLLALDPPREELHRRIVARAQAIARGGILEEARALVARFGAAPPRLPIGYAEAVACVRGELAPEDLAGRIAMLHRRYARRQVIWLRREPDVEWLRPPFDAVAVARMCRTAP
ncbi:MAG TPA: tRNA (adenosine(37)-N6)-dimethylallyltransferase MiaA [Anaeromyxobacteraceae bacterium]|nr:tRNA (adenosine(37)-N6)-dimethylallyltransferase MiaA [Anaeromyxobacteraceae bacterium]